MNKRVYGVFGIASRMSNWNADFTGYPKTTSTGDVFGSDKSFKYPIKRAWQDSGEKVLYIKSFKIKESKDGDELYPRSLKERYEEIFGVEDLKKSMSSKEVLENLFTAIDVKNFGATFAEEGKNISITGAVQIGQGMNKYRDSNAEEQQILSPFRDGSTAAKGKEDAKSSTLGTKIVSDEAHYVYPFAINSRVYSNYVDLGVTEGYTDQDYEKFKRTSILSATSYSTNAKIGCENELAVFIETESDVYLPDLSQYVEFEKGEGELDIYSLNFGELINALEDRVKSVEIYYNPLTLEIRDEIKKAKRYNIFTQKEV